MKMALRILSLLFVFSATAACASEQITGPGRTPGDPLHDGLGYLGGGGRSSVSTNTAGIARP
jgi:hypothetical protein